MHIRPGAPTGAFGDMLEERRGKGRAEIIDGVSAALLRSATIFK